MSEKLRECPCGGLPEIIHWSETHDIECQSCGVTLAGYDNEDELIADWNRRPTEDALRAENERLQKRVGELEGDAKRMHWMLSGNGYFMEEQGLCGHGPCDEEEQNQARAKIDEAIAYDALTPPATKEGK